jgi:hypothetical protein
MKEIIDMWTSLKVKTSAVKDTVKRINKPQIGIKYFVNDTCNKGLTYKMYKQCFKIQQEENTLIKKWAKDLNRHLTKKEQ